MQKGWFAALLIPVFAFTCNKENTWLEGKVLRTSCASFVVQVTNTDKVGEDGWKDMTRNNTTYDNVFAVNNKCTLPAGIKAGATIRFKIDKPAPNNCIVCMMYDGPPETKYDIKDISVVDAK